MFFFACCFQQIVWETMRIKAKLYYEVDIIQVLYDLSIINTWMCWAHLLFPSPWQLLSLPLHHCDLYFFAERKKVIQLVSFWDRSLKWLGCRPVLSVSIGVERRGNINKYACCLAIGTALPRPISLWKIKDNINAARPGTPYHTKPCHTAIFWFETRPEKRKSAGMRRNAVPGHQCRDTGVLFELNKCQRRGETASKLRRQPFHPFAWPRPNRTELNWTDPLWSLVFRHCCTAFACPATPLSKLKILTL